MTPSTTPADLHAVAARRVDIKMGFLVHLTVFIAVNGALALLQFMHGGSLHLPFPVWGWGIGLLAHGLGSLVSLQGPSLRERLLASELATLQKR